MTEEKYPFYFKCTVILFGLSISVFILWILRDVLVPVCFAGLIATLLNPLCNKLQRRMPRVVAILLVILVALLLTTGVLYFLSSQIASFFENLDAVKVRFNNMIGDIQQWLEQKLGIASEKQVEMVKDAVNNSKAVIGQTLSGIMGVLAVVFLIPVYTFLLMFYKTLILNFLFEVFSKKNTEKVGDVLAETKTAIQSYVVGLLLETTLVAILNCTALLLIGIENAILIGVIGAILNLLPYIGGIVAIALPVLMATLTKDGFSAQLLVIGAYAVIQFIDNNIFMPRIVSSKVQINALVSIVIVLMGAGLWGISGMFLSIPFIAVLKIVFDRVDDLKPWGKLLGDNVPTRQLGQVLKLTRKRKGEGIKV
ncbi:MAG: AI-2E family transporter [Sphingobacteriales bacterium]|nr:MAG: AI-2E family transporter [Sphingobacteriales bacterium]